MITLTGVTDLPTETLSVMAGHQLPLLSFLVPLYMVRCMCSWKQTLEVWPALLVAGGSFAVFQYTFATIHSFVPAIVVYPMTDIGGGIFSLILTAAFLKLWKPRKEWHFVPPKEETANPPVAATCDDGHAEAAAAVLNTAAISNGEAEVPLNQSQADLEVIAKKLEITYPQTNRSWRVFAVPLHSEVVANIRPVMLALMGAVIFLLMIVSANLANLMLAWAASRSRER